MLYKPQQLHNVHWFFFFARGFCFRRKCHKHTHTQCTSTSLQRAVDIPDASLLLICWWFQSWPPDDDDDEKNLPGDKQKREEKKSGGKIIIKVSDYTGEFIYIWNSNCVLIKTNMKLMPPSIRHSGEIKSKFNRTLITVHFYSQPFFFFWALIVYGAKRGFFGTYTVFGDMRITINERYCRCYLHRERHKKRANVFILTYYAEQNHYCNVRHKHTQREYLVMWNSRRAHNSLLCF